MRALIPREGSAPVRDRLLMTLFIAALIHGMVILGLTFAGGSAPDGAARGLDVLLTSEELPTANRNDTAAYLAQRTQLGSGNTSGPAIAHNEASPGSPPVHAGDAQGTSLSSSAPAASRADDPVLSTVAQRTDIRYFSAVQGEAGVSREQPLAADVDSPPRPPDSDTGAVQLRGVQRAELWITPDTRESIIAPYLDSWRRRVERVGTLNYPTAAQRSGVQASPVLEVAIDADGRLAKAEILTSSGYPDLDAAALAILKLASPFDPFTPDLAARYHTLRFAYEWQFTGGGSPRDTWRRFLEPSCCCLHTHDVTQSSYTNHLLIAMPALTDSDFSHSVTLVCEHSDKGALGLVLNKPSPMMLRDVLTQMKLEPRDEQIGAQPVLCGGPVRTDRGFVLHRPGGEWDSTHRVSELIQVTTSRDVLAAMARGEGPSDAYVALGFARWDAGQLEREIRENSWLPVPADERLLFDLPFTKRWQASWQFLGVDVEKLSLTAGNA